MCSEPGFGASVSGSRTTSGAGSRSRPRLWAARRWPRLRPLLPAEPAARRRDEVALPAALFEIDAVFGGDFYDVGELGILGVLSELHSAELVAGFQNGFGIEKTDRELFVVAGAAHDHGDTLPVEADLERLFHRELVLKGLAGAVGDVDAIDPVRRRSMSAVRDIDESLLVVSIITTDSRSSGAWFPRGFIPERYSRRVATALLLYLQPGPN